MRGRKPKPTSVKLLAGNPGHRPLNDSEPVAPEGIPECPEFLDDEARAEWMRTCAALKQMDLLSTADRSTLAAFCVAYSRWVAAEKATQKYGTVVKSPNGFPMKSPYLCIAESALEQMRKLATEFGLTPSSRSRIRVGSEHPTGGLDAFIARGRRA
ncbi:MAG TPA: phage terminase small subunit P27 family [Pirellulales bacterium]|jgi:P27 family predicted phage terminase small subunit